MQTKKPKKANQVFDIIRKLDTGEKRSFNIYASAYEKKSNITLRLFDIIYDYTHGLSADAEAQERDIAVQLKKANISSQYTSAKNRLKSILLDFLYHLNAESNEIEQLHQRVVASQTLIARGQKDAGLDILADVKKAAMAFEAFDVWTTCIEVELYIAQDASGDGDLMKAALAEYDDVMAMAQEYMHAKYESNLIRKYVLSRTPVPASLPDISQLVHNISLGKSVSSRHQYYLALVSIHTLPGSPSMPKEIRQDHMQMLEGFMKPVAGDVARYFTSLWVYLTLSLSDSDPGSCSSLLTTAEAKYVLYSRYMSPNVKVHVIIQIGRYKMLYLTMTGDNEALHREAKRVEALFLKDRLLIKPAGHLVMMLLMRNAFFRTGDYAGAEKWVGESREAAYSSATKLLSGSIVELISAYELKCDTESMRTIVKKTKYYLQQKTIHPALISFMDSFLLLATDLHTARGPEEQRRVRMLLADLFQPDMPCSDPILAELIESSDMRFWLQAAA